MKLSEIRIELLGQHADVRAKLEETLEAAARWRRDDRAREDLRATLARLAEAVNVHNRREEELLGGIIPTIDAWGDVRSELMNEAHFLEHKQVYEALVSVGATSDSETASACISALNDRMRQQMAHEEKIFLGEDVLGDDPMALDYFGG